MVRIMLGSYIPDEGYTTPPDRCRRGKKGKKPLSPAAKGVVRRSNGVGRRRKICLLCRETASHDSRCRWLVGEGRRYLGNVPKNRATRKNTRQNEKFQDMSYDTLTMGTDANRRETTGSRRQPTSLAEKTVIFHRATSSRLVITPTSGSNVQATRQATASGIYEIEVAHTQRRHSAPVSSAVQTYTPPYTLSIVAAVMPLPKSKAKKARPLPRVPQQLSQEFIPSEEILFSPQPSFEGTPRTPDIDLSSLPTLEATPEEEQEILELDEEVAIEIPVTAGGHVLHESQAQQEEGHSSHHPSEEEPYSDEGGRQRSINIARRQEGRLAEWLQDNQYLYNRAEPDYRNKEKKKRAFQEMGASLTPPLTGEELTRWFNTRRTQYGRITKKISPSGAGAPHLTELEKWILKLFAFMQPHILRHKDTKVLGTQQVMKI